MFYAPRPHPSWRATNLHFYGLRLQHGNALIYVASSPVIDTPDLPFIKYELISFPVKGTSGSRT